MKRLVFAAIPGLLTTLFSGAFLMTSRVTIYHIRRQAA